MTMIIVKSFQGYALSSKKDMFIPITTSGKVNLITSKIANKKGLKTVALTGATGGDLNELCSAPRFHLWVPNTRMSYINWHLL